MCEASASIHGSHELEHKMDKKSVIVTLANGVERKFIEEEGVSYDYQIGERNGCLMIVEKREVDTEFSVPDTEETVFSYAANMWACARMVDFS